LLTLPNDEWRKQNKNVERRSERAKRGARAEKRAQVRCACAENALNGSGRKAEKSESAVKALLACLSGRPGFRVCGQVITFERSSWNKDALRAETQRAARKIA